MDNTDFYWDDIWEEKHNSNQCSSTDVIENVYIEESEQCNYDCENCWCTCEKEKL